MDINTVIRLACLKYLDNDAVYSKMSVNDLIVAALTAYIDAP